MKSDAIDRVGEGAWRAASVAATLGLVTLATLAIPRESLAQG